MTTFAANRVLVVDDEPDMVRGIRRLLRLKGLEVETALSGEEAVEKARNWQPHGILIDLKMGDMDGLEAYRKIRPLCPSAFVIFMTAFSSLAKDAVDEGAVQVLTKPFNPAKTCDLIVDSLISKSGAGGDTGDTRTSPGSYI
jgi:CheY-like chemotaxis protein